MEELKEGTLKSGKSGKKVNNPKQAVAIGLSQGREKGEKVPTPKKKKKYGGYFLIPLVFFIEIILESMP